MLKVDIWSDIACPWCFIGKRRFEAGLRQFESSQQGADVAVELRAPLLRALP